MRVLKTKGRSVFLIAILLSVASLIHAEATWPQFQYNAQHIGYNPDATIRWPLSVKWSKKVSNAHLEQPTIVGDHVYIVTRDAHYQREFNTVWCLGMDSGDVKWSRSYDERIQEICQPSYAYGTLYLQITNWYDSLLALDPATGERKWANNFRAQHNYGLAPMIYGDKIIVCGDYYGGMTCFNAFTGEWLWRADMDQRSEWTPAAYKDRVYTWEKAKLQVWNIETGERIWLYEPLEDTTLYDKGILDPDNAPVLDTTTGIIYLTAKTFTMAVNVDTQEPLWKADDSCCHRVTPALYDGNLYTIEMGGVRKRDGLTGEVLEEFMPNEPIEWLDTNEPIIANGYLFASSNTRFYIIMLEPFMPLWIYNTGGPLAVAGDHLVVAGRNGVITCYEGSIATSVDDPDGAPFPHSFALHQNYPNPFNNSTIISYDLPRRSHVEISVYNILGRRVSTLLSNMQSAGTHSVEWHGTDDRGRTLSSGTYFYRVKADDQVQTRKMALLK